MKNKVFKCLLVMLILLILIVVIFFLFRDPIAQWLGAKFEDLRCGLGEF